MNGLGKLLIGAGILIAVAGGILLLLSKTGIPFGRLPGDFSYKGKNASFYFPLTTCIILSVVASLIFYFVSRFHR